VWLVDGFWFSTGSLAIANLKLNPSITIRLEDGDKVVIAEGRAMRETSTALLAPMCEAYGPKYDDPNRPVDGEVRDSSGVGGPAYRSSRSGSSDGMQGWRARRAGCSRRSTGRHGLTRRLTVMSAPRSAGAAHDRYSTALP